MSGGDKVIPKGVDEQELAGDGVFITLTPCKLYGMFKRFWSLSSREKSLWFRALLYLYVIRLILVSRGYKKAYSFAVNHGNALRSSKGSRKTARKEIAWAIRSASRFCPRATCLVMALAGLLLFRQYGFCPEFHIGVARIKGEEEKGFEAHAWLSLDGEIVIGKLKDMSYLKSLPLFHGAQKR